MRPSAPDIYFPVFPSFQVTEVIGEVDVVGEHKCVGSYDCRNGA